VATLLEKAEKLGAKIGKRKLCGYAVYRIICSACPKLGTREGQVGTNYSSADIRTAMNDHARGHIDGAKAFRKPEPLKRECTLKHYQVAITPDQYLAIEAYDRAKGNYVFQRTGLAAELDELDGVNDADYNGHFGAFVFLQIETEHDTPARWEEIEKLIRQAVAHREPKVGDVLPLRIRPAWEKGHRPAGGGDVGTLVKVTEVRPGDTDKARFVVTTEDGGQTCVPLAFLVDLEA